MSTVYTYENITSRPDICYIEASVHCRPLSGFSVSGLKCYGVEPGCSGVDGEFEYMAAPKKARWFAPGADAFGEWEYLGEISPGATCVRIPGDVVNNAIGLGRLSAPLPSIDVHLTDLTVLPYRLTNHTLETAEWSEATEELKVKFTVALTAEDKAVLDDIVDEACE